MEGERLSDPALGPEARTAADRVLSTPELLRAVFDVLGDDGRYELSGSGQLNRNTLASCARVCRDFSVHALDVLWTNNHDLLTLLKILPSFQFLNGQWVRVEPVPVDNRHVASNPLTYSAFITVAGRSRHPFCGMDEFPDVRGAHAHFTCPVHRGTI